MKKNHQDKNKYVNLINNNFDEVFDIELNEYITKSNKNNRMKITDYDTILYFDSREDIW